MALHVVGARCHGMLSEPKARNVLHNSNYCPHCLSAGGPGVTYAGGRVWPKSMHGVCGDPAAGPLDHEAGGKFASKKITGTYVKGQRITVRVTITAPHGGRFSFGLCPVPDGATPVQERLVVTQKCIDANRLKNAEDGSFFWWLGKKGTGEYTIDLLLPPEVSCKRCVLQWHYETGNSCTMPGTPEQHVVSPGMVPCDKSPNMEEFWNCADVAILAKGGRKPIAAGTPSGKPRLPVRRVRIRETFTEHHRRRSDLLAAGAVVLGLAAMGAAAVLPLAAAVVLAAVTAAVLVTYAIGRQRRQVVASPMMLPSIEMGGTRFGSIKHMGMFDRFDFGRDPRAPSLEPARLFSRDTTRCVRRR